ncbi:transporter substrate-binding domain-containing protein [Trinickia acidisoli]|uniref:transporter substrate-binding domain-containing protein n=1 Tax=Trinickia acidisoli TaxID=2767482 RepID=UPI001A8CBDCA|nr:transporter substrate-binding domain-containing protein [Trinickia acidisoli]
MTIDVRTLERRCTPRWRRCTTLVSCVLPLIVGMAHADDRLDAIKARGVLIVGVKTDYPPFGMLASDASHEGFEDDLAADLARRLGVTLRTLSVSSTNRLQALDEGRIDVTIATLGDTAERRKIATLIEPDYYASGVTLMTRADAKIGAWADVRGATVCATQGSYFNREMATRYLLHLQIYANGRDAKLAVRDSRCIGWLFDNTAIEGDLQTSEWRDYRITLPPQLSTPWAIAVARSERGSALERFIGDAVADWHRTGFLIALERKWGLPPSPFLADMHRLWTARDADGRYLCSRHADGQWPVACRNPAFVTSTDVTGLRRWGLRFAERTGIDLTYVYDDYERCQFLQAIALSLALTVCCVLGSLACGIVLALLAATPPPMVGPALRTVALLARTTPPLLQIYVLTFGVGSVLAARWHLRPNAFWIVVASLSIYTGAGIMRTLEDAARHERMRNTEFAVRPSTLGLLLRHTSPSIRSLLVNVTKATMMASAVAVPELLSVSTSIIADHGNVATMMNTLMILFASLVWAVLRLLRAVERRWVDARD